MVVWGLARDKKEGKGEASKAPERTFFCVMKGFIIIMHAHVYRSELTKLYFFFLLLLLLLLKSKTFMTQTSIK